MKFHKFDLTLEFLTLKTAMNHFASNQVLRKNQNF